MPRSIRVERDFGYGIGPASTPSFSNNPFDPANISAGSRRTSREALVNIELVQSNQRLQARLQKMSSAYQVVEQQNVALRDKCLRLQNRIDELTDHLVAIKEDVGQRVPSLRLIAGHLSEVATFLEALDHSIELGDNPSPRTSSQSALVSGGTSSSHRAEGKKNPLESIKENPEGP